MPKYKVEVVEHITTIYEITATDEENAEYLIDQGKGNMIGEPDSDTEIQEIEKIDDE